MLQEYIERIKKAHPMMVSFFLRKYEIADDGSVQSVIKAYRKAGDVFLRDWYSQFHTSYNKIEGDDGWFESFKAWFSDGSAALDSPDTTIVKKLNSETSTSKTLTESEIYEKQERQIWIIFLGVSIITILVLLFFLIKKRRS